MARPQKRGLDYFPTDVDIFSDRKIKIVMARYKSDGYTLYSYLLCEIFKEGYYLKEDEDLEDIIASDLNMSYEKIGQIINFFCKRSLFNDKLFTTDKVLTSEGIQRRYQSAIKGRAVKNPVAVDERFWLLNEEETESFIKVRPISNFSEKNYDNSKKNNDNSENNDTKKSKVNKSKVKESKGEKESASADSHPHQYPNRYGRYENVYLKDDEYTALKGEFPNDYAQRIERLSEYIASSGKKYKNHLATIRSWAKSDIKKAQSDSDRKSSFDIDDLQGLGMFND